jgi:hypothetical protein
VPDNGRNSAGKLGAAIEIRRPDAIGACPDHISTPQRRTPTGILSMTPGR